MWNTNTDRLSYDKSSSWDTQISGSLIRETVTQHLHQRRKHAKWELAGGHKSKRIGAALTFFERYQQDVDNLGRGGGILVALGAETQARRSWEQTPTSGVAFSFAVKTHEIQTDVVNPESPSHCFLGTGKASFWLNSCPKAKPSAPSLIVQVWRDYLHDSCRQDWFCCTTKRGRWLLLVHVRYLLALPWALLTSSLNSRHGSKRFSPDRSLEAVLGGTCMSSVGEEKSSEDWFNGLAPDFYSAGIRQLVTSACSVVGMWLALHSLRNPRCPHL
jgi:hypothetical protein